MLKLGVLNFTLKFPPVPNKSVIDPVLLGTGAGAATGLEIDGEDTLEDLDPETAEETVCETKGEISATTWDTISAPEEDEEVAVTGLGVGAGRLEAPDTADDTVCEIKG